MKKVLLLGNFFLITPVVFLLSILFLLFLTDKSTRTNYFVTAQAQTVHYAALPSTENIFSSDVISKDSRVEMLTQFFQHYNSPLEPYAKLIVDSADAYDLDFRLVPSIAMQESNLCHKIPEGSYNCWGFGIYGKTITRFESYQQAIQTVTKTLATKYKTKGLVTPEQIMSMYTPSSNGSWAHGVNTFMNELQ